MWINENFLETNEWADFQDADIFVDEATEKHNKDLNSRIDELLKLPPVESVVEKTPDVTVKKTEVCTISYTLQMVFIQYYNLILHLV